MLFGSMATSMATQPALAGLIQLGLSTPAWVSPRVCRLNGTQPLGRRQTSKCDTCQKHGLEVVIARGSGSVAAAQAIGEGRFGFGMATPSIAILQTHSEKRSLAGPKSP